MTKIAISPNVNGTGTFTIAAPNSNTNRTLTLPDAGGEVFSQGNIIGTVLESAGVPTGAIIQRGSNANGTFVRHADGTQICYMAGRESRSTTGVVSTVMTFPAAFIDENLAPDGRLYSAQLTLDTGVPQTATQGTVTATQLSGLTVRIDRSTATNTVFSLLVIGRWF